MDDLEADDVGTANVGQVASDTHPQIGRPAPASRFGRTCCDRKVQPLLPPPIAGRQ
jgi:hypothetical protein